MTQPDHARRLALMEEAITVVSCFIDDAYAHLKASTPALCPSSLGPRGANSENHKHGGRGRRWLVPGGGTRDAEGSRSVRKDGDQAERRAVSSLKVLR